MPNRKRPGPYRDDAYSNANIIAELQRAARRVVGGFTHAQFRRAGGRVDPATVRAHFGSWKEALRRAGLRHRLRPRAVGAKHSWEECYANMERTWRRLGRAPAAGDMDRDPSHVSSGTYKMRFGLWRNALVAFEADRAGDKSAWPMPGYKNSGKPQRERARGNAEAVRSRTQRRAEFGPDRIVIPIRHRVLTRENFRCAWCADSPAKNSRCRLYVQYLIPPMDGGPRDRTESHGVVFVMQPAARTAPRGAAAYARGGKPTEPGRAGDGRGLRWGSTQGYREIAHAKERRHGDEAQAV